MRSSWVVWTVWAGVTIGVEGYIVGHVGLWYLLVGEEGVAGGKFGVAGDKHWGHHRGLHSLVVVGVDADFHLLGGEGVLADLQRLQLMMGLQVRPPPHPAVDHMGQPFTVRNLQVQNLSINI